MASVAAPWHALFVYGTLKRGFTNYARYLGLAEGEGKAAFVGEASTVASFALVVQPEHVPPHTRPPVLMEREGCGHRIAGEVFEVDESTLEALDLLEGVKEEGATYYKRQVVVRMERGGLEVRCTAYFFPASEALLALQHLPAYSAEQHALYRPAGPAREEILEPCRRRLPHGLSTPEPLPVRAHCLRLLPGEDLLAALRAFAAEHRLAAAAVLACVGSTGRTTLRPAGVSTPRVFAGKYEIVSLTGTISSSGHHLHMSISDAECNVFGGHVLEGCIVRTTAEIILGLLDGARFTRPLDARTGYDELSIALRPAAGGAIADAARALKRARTDAEENG